MLKRLELVGFKSFADKTAFEFPPGVTAIVGPNGSGKSNVVDAVKWVLGEQSAKSLRGGEMADVIFNGSTSRRSLGMAEVSLLFDNGRGVLNTTAAEVRIARRVYRDGEGEYLINGQACRLKDIKDLFLGSGAGTPASCIIEQGRVDALLQASTHDRRMIFEEAAGISRFKVKKIESLRRLERVEQNLQRLRDILSEVESQLRGVRLQAAKAQRHQEYSQRLRELRVALGLREYHELSEQLTAVVAVLQQLRGEVAQAAALSANWVRDTRRLEEELLRLETAAREQEGRIAQAAAAIAGHQARLAAERAQTADTEADVARIRRQLADADGRIAGLTAARESAEGECQAAEEQCHAQRRQVQALAQRLHELVRQLTDFARQIEADKVEHLERMRLVVRLQNDATHARAHLEQLSRERDRLSHKNAQAAEHLEKLDLELDTLVQAESGLQANLSAARQTLAEQADELARNRAAIDGQGRRLADLRARGSGLASRIEVLEGLERSHEGLGTGIKEVISLLDEGRSPALADTVVGLVGDLLSAPREYAPLLDLALGATAQCFVVRDLQRVTDALAELPAPISGRVSFLPLRPGEACGNDFVAAGLSPRGRGLKPAATKSGPETGAAADLPDRVLRASDLVLCDRSDLADLPEQVLGDTLIVPDLRTARALAAEHPGYRFVTRQGELLDGDGVLTVGTYHEGAGILSRKSELRDLRQQAADLAAEVAHAESDLAELHERAAALDGETRNLRQETDVLTEQAADLRERIAQHRERREGLHEDVTLNRSELSNLDAEIARLDASWAEARARAEEAEQEVRVLQARLTDMERATRGHEHERAAAEQTHADAKVSLAQLEERLAALGARHEQLAADLHERHLERDRLDGHLRAGLTRLADGERTQLEAGAALAAWCHAREVAEREVARVTEERDVSRAALRQLQEQMQSAHSAWQAQQEQLHARELAESDLRHRRDTLVQRLREDCEVELEEEYAARSQESAVGSQEDAAKLDGAQEEIDDLRKKLARLGSVNLDSLQELAELERRDDALRVQYDDLVAAQKHLQEIITTINEDSRRLFSETFALIRGNFQDLFRKLFGGGQADVVLENEVDVLESGIEVMARPPGKELRSISLMSGGEKTLTAVALLLAIFRSKPSPFCLLDEVDAALDEANTARMAGVLKEFLDRSQFIIVTHSKRTMSSADVLYGVTMQESGVSKPVAVKFEDWPDEEPQRRAA
jgi:chromosome segregation protein